MTLKKLELSGFKSFGKKATLSFDVPIVAIVGPNGSGKSNVAEAFRWVLGEQSLKSLRGKKGEDLIFNGSSSLGRLSHASVSITFDNTDRRFNIDFDEVTINREVFRDGTNEYAVNNSKVRLKDVLELLANVSLGPSGHHIISQGEADRILNANLAERRIMIEEALGLKIYQWKLQESEKKLIKTRENIREVESLRREIAPHLKFLKKQVEKIEKANELREELSGKYREYLKREEIYLAYWQEKIKKDLVSPQEALSLIETKIADWQERPSEDRNIEGENQLREIESGLRRVRAEKDELSRKLGRLEGMIELKERELAQKKSGPATISVSREYLEGLEQELETKLSEAERTSDLSLLASLMRDIKRIISDFFVKYKITHSGNTEKDDSGLEEIRQEKYSIEVALTKLENEEQHHQSHYQTVKLSIEQEERKIRQTEREIYELRAKRSEVVGIIQSLRNRLESLSIEEENFKRELGEAAVLVGREVLNYQDFSVSVDEAIEEERGKQEERRRLVERLKIRLEDSGVEGVDVLKEFEEVTNRDGYLAKELEDLAVSAKSLEEVMTDLRSRIDVEFKEGIIKINREFQKFFEILFGGGSAALSVVLPEKKKIKTSELLETEEGLPIDQETIEPGEEGIDIAVNLPRKKIKGLAMLSGGERALTSIALLFAMSQVNPPPFLILDETEAALDEANSRKYGDMIENLGKYSQLILITHNRETMSRAGVIYGVTMGSDSVSRLISIKFDEAETYAK